MNKLSDVLIELTKEVLNICEENGIPCVLADETVYQMMRNEGDLDKLQSVYLVVKADDLDKLYECLNKTNIPNRGVESMKNNDFYPDFSMRYVNLETTCSMDKDGFMYPAIGIFIVPIRKKIKKLQRTYFYRLEHWTLGNGRKIYPQLLSLYKLGHNKTGIMRGMKRKGCNYQVSEFSENNILSVQGMEFPISSLNSNRKNFSYGISQFVAYDTVYSFVQNGVEIKERKGSKNLFVNFLKELWKRISKRIWKRIYPITQDWDKINCVNEQNLLELEIMINFIMQDIKDYIMEKQQMILPKEKD